LDVAPRTPGDTCDPLIPDNAINPGDEQPVDGIDQRGFDRPAAPSGECDAGAFELQVPGTPAITDSDPDSPSMSAGASIKGTAPGATTVFLYDEADCQGPATDIGSPGIFASPGFAVSVPLNQTSTFTVNAQSADGVLSPCTDEFLYTHDSIALAPAITATTPSSGSEGNAPAVKGTTEAGSTVRVYGSGTCTGTPLAAGTAAAFSSSGLTISVADNSTTSLVAGYTDQAGNVSPCSAPFTYAEVTAAATKKCKKGRKLKKGKCVKKKRKKKRK
jgi:hypothetical protein